MSRKILFLVPYPLYEAPSQRFRFEQYIAILERNNYRVKVKSFLFLGTWRMFSSTGNVASKLKLVAIGFVNRVKTLLTSPMYDFVFIHREVAPIGPPVFEWILAKILRRRIIYDFDDAIWLTDRTAESLILKLFKWRSKVGAICRWSYKVSCGNAYLCDFARQFNTNVIFNPTTLDTENLHNPDLYPHIHQTSEKIRIGWTGSYSTLKYISIIESVLKKILVRYPSVEFIVIADKKPDLQELCTWRFIQWNSNSEIVDLLQFDIGVMPLPDDEWAKGKCGFKALQYMSLCFPVVASPVGVNTQIIKPGINGFLCSTDAEWENALSVLIESPDLRKKMGRNGRQTILDHYSVISNSDNFLCLFE
jgi:glycosyltransferase involved in cell wall biosynthesis